MNPPTAPRRTLGLLTASEFFGAIGWQVIFFLAPLAAITLLGASPIEIALLNLTESAAALVFGLGVGAVVDRLGGAAGMVAANLVRAAAAALLAVSLVAGPTLWVLFATLFLMGIAQLLHETSVSTAVVEYIGREGRQLNRANSLLRTSTVISEVGGAGFGGALLAVVSFGAAAAMGAAGFAIAAGCAAVVWSTSVTLQQQNRRPQPGKLLDGLRFIISDRFLKPLVATSLHFNFFSAVFAAVFILFLVRVLGMHTWEIGIIGVVAGLGGLLGAYLASTAVVERHARRIYAVSMTLPAACVVIMLFAQVTDDAILRLLLISLADAVFSACMVICIVLFSTARQLSSPDNLLGQIASSERMIAIGGEVPGALLGGVLATLFSIQLSLVVGLVGMGLSAIWMLKVKTWPTGSV